MAKRSIQERLRQLEARKQALVARLGKEERARDTRRKILIGALVLDRIERQPERYLSGRLDEWLRAELAGFLTRENDRALFHDILGQNESPITGTVTGTGTGTGMGNLETAGDGEELPSSPASNGEDQS
jgi:hypothetical protein